MNTNQQKLNLTTMETRKARVSFKATSNRWLVFVNELKNEIDNNKVTSLTYYTRMHNISNQWGAFLKTNNVVFINEKGYYQWNDKIPVSKKLIDSFRKYQMEKNMKYYPERYPKMFKVDPKKVINVKPKIVREKVKNTETKQIGLIRKFLKWIY